MSKSQRAPILPAALLAVGLVIGLVGGFGLGRSTAPSGLAALEGLLPPASARPTPLPRGTDNDGQVALIVDAAGIFDTAGVTFVEKSGKIALGVRNDAAETVTLTVARNSDPKGEAWENVYSTRIEAGKLLAGEIELKVPGPYRVTAALASSLDTISEVRLAIWTPE